ncbi:MAG: hypothetical protein ACRDJE_00215 [Dehalococcoidia bacterium]
MTRLLGCSKTDFMSIERPLLQQNPRARILLYRAAGLAFLAAALWLVLAWLLSEVVSRVFLGHQTLSDVGGLLALMAALMLVRAGPIRARRQRDSGDDDPSDGDGNEGPRVRGEPLCWR